MNFFKVRAKARKALKNSALNLLLFSKVFLWCVCFLKNWGFPIFLFALFNREKCMLLCWFYRFWILNTHSGIILFRFVLLSHYNLMTSIIIPLFRVYHFDKFLMWDYIIFPSSFATAFNLNYFIIIITILRPMGVYDTVKSIFMIC